MLQRAFQVRFGTKVDFCLRWLCTLDTVSDVQMWNGYCDGCRSSRGQVPVFLCVCAQLEAEVEEGFIFCQWMKVQGQKLPFVLFSCTIP